MSGPYPQNFKEAIIFSIPNAMTMVLGMVTLNLWIYGALTPMHFARTVPIMFAVAFTLDFFVVGPLVMRFVSRYKIMRLMPVFRVGLMAGILTFVAPVLEAGHIITAHQYITAVPRNYVAALILQVCIAMPIAIVVFRRYKMRIAAQ